MRILVSGSTGFLGTALVETLQGQGHAIARLVRPGTARKDVAGVDSQAIAWDPVAGRFDAAGAEGAEALIHLAGASIAGGRWNASRKELLRTSRIDATRHLMGALSKLQRPPRVIVAASAVGYYGNRGEEALTEASAPGTDLLAGAVPRMGSGNRAGSRVRRARGDRLRFGIILAAHGGAAAADGVAVQARGGRRRLGDGRQWDVLADSAGEPSASFNSPWRLQGLARDLSTLLPRIQFKTRNSRSVLAKSLRRPALFPAPAFALRMALGEMADALLLISQSQ